MYESNWKFEIQSNKLGCLNKIVCSFYFALYCSDTNVVIHFIKCKSLKGSCYYFMHFSLLSVITDFVEMNNIAYF